MKSMISLYHSVFVQLEKLDFLTPLLARFIFAATLLLYYWNSGLTKLGDGIWGFLFPSDGAYVQIFPKAMEAVTYDSSQLGTFHWLVVLGGTWAEFILPALIVIGLLTRIAALGMIGFVVLQSLTDLYGHGGIAHAETFGAWFDRLPDSVIMDQRAFWLFLLIMIAIKGAGALSVDRALKGVTGETDEPRMA